MGYHSVGGNMGLSSFV